MAEGEWIVIAEVNPETAQFPLVTAANGDEIVIFRTGSRLRGIERWCPHQGADLKAARLIGEMIKCPLHGYIFRLDKGVCANFPGLSADVYEVSTEGAQLRVRRVGPGRPRTVANEEDDET